MRYSKPAISIQNQIARLKNRGLTIVDEEIEISFRTQVIYQWAIVHGSHWHLESSLFRNSTKFEKHLTHLNKEVDRSTETVIDHYKKKYTQPQEPPA